jgi:hypothetical protein
MTFTRPLALALCIVSGIGCRSIRARHASTETRGASAAATTGRSSHEREIGQASYEQVAADPPAPSWGQSTYYSGGSNSSGGSFSQGRSGGPVTLKRC